MICSIFAQSSKSKPLKTLIGVFVIGGLALVSSPATSRAAVLYNPTTQSDWQAIEAFPPGGGYVGGYPVFTNNGGPQGFQVTGISGTVYVSVSSAGTIGHLTLQRYTGSVDNVYTFTVPTTTAHYSVSLSSGHYLQFGAGASLWSSDTDARPSFFCVSTTSFAECDALVPVPLPGSWEQVLASTTPGTTTAQLIGSSTLGLCIIISLLAFGLIGYVHTSIFGKRKRKWQ